MKERVKDAGERKLAKKAEGVAETPEEAFSRIGAMSLTEKEREAFDVAKSAYLSGEIGSLRTDGGKWTKSDVLTAGYAILRKKEEGARRSRIAETIRTKPPNYHIVTSDDELPRMVERLREEVRLQQSDEWFRKVFDRFNDTMIRRKLAERGVEIPAVVSLTVWDTETSGLDKMIDLTGGYSLWLPLLNEGYYVAYGHLTGEKQCTRSKALGAIERFMSLAQHVKSFHNAAYDLAILINDGLTPRGVRYDSADAQRILNEHEESFALKPLFTKYKAHIGVEDIDDYTFEDLFGNDSPMIHPVEVVGIYAIKDVYKGWRLTRWQIDNLIATDRLAVAFFEIRQYLPEINVNIERTGFPIDIDGLAKIGAEYRKKLAEAQAEVIRAYGVESPEFLRKMDRVVNAKKIADWIESQRKRRARLAEAIAKKREKIAEMEAAGKTHLKSYANEVEALKRYEKELAELPEPTEDSAPMFIERFEFTNDNHLRYLIYDHLGIRDRTKEISKDKSKERAVSKDVLERYFAEEEALAPLAAVSMYEKLLGTYVEKIPEALDVDGRLHTQLNTVSTGRYSSQGYAGKPNDVRPKGVNDSNFLDVMRLLVDVGEKSVSKGTNVQNIPSRNDEGLRVRMCFVPPPGHVFVGSDLSSIEPRIQSHRMATEFGDEIFAEMFRKNLDPYVEFAAMLFEVPAEHCVESYAKTHPGTPPYRKIMKQLFLAIGYGQAFDAFYKTVAKYVSEEQARKAYAKFDEVLPGFRRMVESTFEHLRKHGWTETLWGQKRRFPGYREKWRRLCALMRRAGITDKNDPELGRKTRNLHPVERTEFWSLIRETGRDERAAFNHTIQGSGANVLQLCMIRSYYELTVARGWEFVLTLHDEQKHAAPIWDLTPETVALYDDIMTNTVTLACPLKCDTVIEPRWMQEYDESEWDFANGRPLPEFAGKYAKYSKEEIE